jgi:hypothetical protein
MLEPTQGELAESARLRQAIVDFERSVGPNTAAGLGVSRMALEAAGVGFNNGDYHGCG